MDRDCLGAEPPAEETSPAWPTAHDLALAEDPYLAFLVRVLKGLQNLDSPPSPKPRPPSRDDLMDLSTNLATAALNRACL